MISSVPTWESLPEMFKRELVAKLDYKSRCRLRKCSRQEKKLVDGCPVHLRAVSICLTHHAQLQITSRTLPFARCFHNTEDVGGIIDDFLMMLRHPKSTIGKLELISYTDHIVIDPSESLIQLLFNALETLPFEYPIRSEQLNWNCFSKSFPKDALQKTLDFFDPQYLTTVFIQDEVLFDRSFEPLPENISICKKLSIAAPLFFSSKLLHADKLSVNFKAWYGEEIRMIWQSFIQRNAPVGSFFDLHSLANMQLTDIFKELTETGQKRNHEPFNNVSAGRTHVQRFEMRNPQNCLVMVIFLHHVSNRTNRIQGVVCRKDYVEEDWKKSWD